MAVDVLNQLLQDLGALLQTKLHVDENNTCLISFNRLVQIQIELDKTGDNVVIGTNLGNIPVGKYRENLYREALKANGLPPPRHGIFAHSPQGDRMVLFDLLPIKNLTADKLHTFLIPFANKAQGWAVAIAKGELPVLETSSSAAGGGGGLFGLRP